MSGTADIAVYGMGVMGAALARNLASRGHRVAVMNRSWGKTERFMADYGSEGDFVACREPAELAAALKEPRRILLMVKAGAAVDSTIDSLAPSLGSEDMIVDAGNSHYDDTDRRAASARERGFRFLGMGVSGGEEGARLGPAMMPGGEPEAYEALRPILESACAWSDSGPCVAWCGHGSAGHFVKMVHNGIEYGDMQLIAEAHTLLADGMGLGPTAIRDVFEGWNEGRLESFLIEITAGIVAAKDPSGGGPLLHAILDVAGQKGTGRWTAIGAIELGVPLPTVTAAVDSRALSAHRAERLETAAAFEDCSPDSAVEITPADLEAALYCSKLMSYTQGFALLRRASEERGYETDLAVVSRIWKAGCIIRAVFLDRVFAAFTQRPDLPLLLLDPSFADELRGGLGAWRKVVAAAIGAGIPVPAMSASLAYFDTLTRARGSASLIQAQRDWFGAHTYRRSEAPEVPVHTDWSTAAQL
jgi:6-phosphogluconate dehydrogenase